MDFPSPLERGRLVQRYKRFFADVVMDDGRQITAHCPNPGAMLGLNTPGLPAWLSRSQDPKRKLAHTLELIEVDSGLVGVNTMRANALAAEALAAGVIGELTGYDTVRAEVRYGEASRVDFYLTSPNRRPCWLEVKSVTLSRSRGLAEFPDCASARAARHLMELQSMAAAGDRAAVLFVVQRDDCDRFAVAADIDPAFGAALEAATGVEALAYACAMTPTGFHISRSLSIPTRSAASIAGWSA